MQKAITGDMGRRVRHFGGLGAGVPSTAALLARVVSATGLLRIRLRATM
jgi:hypothetical protein